MWQGFFWTEVVHLEVGIVFCVSIPLIVILSCSQLDIAFGQVLFKLNCFCYMYFIIGHWYRNVYKNVGIVKIFCCVGPFWNGFSCNNNVKQVAYNETTIQICE